MEKAGRTNAPASAPGIKEEKALPHKAPKADDAKRPLAAAAVKGEQQGNNIVISINDKPVLAVDKQYEAAFIELVSAVTRSVESKKKTEPKEKWPNAELLLKLDQRQLDGGKKEGVLSFVVVVDKKPICTLGPEAQDQAEAIVKAFSSALEINANLMAHPSAKAIKETLPLMTGKQLDLLEKTVDEMKAEPYVFSGWDCSIYAGKVLPDLKKKVIAFSKPLTESKKGAFTTPFIKQYIDTQVDKIDGLRNSKASEMKAGEMGIAFRIGGGAVMDGRRNDQPSHIIFTFCLGSCKYKDEKSGKTYDATRFLLAHNSGQDNVGEKMQDGVRFEISYDVPGLGIDGYEYKRINVPAGEISHMEGFVINRGTEKSAFSE